MNKDIKNLVVNCYGLLYYPNNDKTQQHYLFDIKYTQNLEELLNVLWSDTRLFYSTALNNSDKVVPCVSNLLLLLNSYILNLNSLNLFTLEINRSTCKVEDSQLTFDLLADYLVNDDNDLLFEIKDYVESWKENEKKGDINGN